MRPEINFEAQDKPVSEVLFSQSKFRVPRYQRQYAWDVDQVSQFWEDLSASDAPYFLGSFIFNTETVREDGFVDIIDGQQRLLTITILIAVLRDLAESFDPERAKRYQWQDIAIVDRDGRESFRIQPADTISEYFGNHIQSFSGAALSSIPSTREEIRVKKAYMYLHERVSAEMRLFESREAQLELLERVRKKVSQLIIISVEIAHEEDAYEIFETTNARGMELSVADLLKNLIFKKIKPGEDRDFAKDVWQEITNDIESTGTELKRFIRYFWISQYAFVTEKKLFREVKNKITDWQGLLNDLWDASIKYNTLLDGDEVDFQDLKDGMKIYEALFGLRLMHVSQCYVLLLAILRNLDKLSTNPARVFQFIERFTFQYSVVCKLPSNRIEKIYSRHALKLHAAASDGPSEKVSKKVQAVFSELEQELKAEAPSQTLFNESFDDLSYKNTEEGRRLIKYILARIDGHYRTTDEQRIDFNTVNIEHLLPQVPSKDWPVTRQQAKPYVNKLGNLTLLSKKLNSKAQNSPMSTKLVELKKSGLPITKQLVSQLEEDGTDWTQAQISLRQQEFARMAFEKLWRI